MGSAVATLLPGADILKAEFKTMQDKHAGRKPARSLNETFDDLIEKKRNEYEALKKIARAIEIADMQENEEDAGTLPGKKRKVAKK